MKLETLISHSGELLLIALKSNKSTDSLVSEYLRQKKYIGSKERKFISDIVFATLRNLSASVYCMESTLKDYLLDDYGNLDSQYLFSDISSFDQSISFAHCLIMSDKIYFERFNQNWYKLLIASTAALIHENHLGSSGKLILNHLNLLYNDSVSLKNEIIYSICLFADVNYNIAVNIYESICSVFSELKRISKTLSKRNYNKLSNDEKIAFATYSCMPLWIIDNLINTYESTDFVMNLSNAFKEQAPTSIRVNQFIHNKEIVSNHLKSNNINVSESKLSPSALILEKRVQLNINPLFKDGFFEVQDEGSQLISFALAPEKKSSVLDACAGAGGKTLHIADIQHDSGRIIAFDTDFLRLKELRKRANKHRYNSIETLFDKNGILPDNLKGTFDFVLIDAPCSGMGTSRRLPLTKWRLTCDLLEKHSRKQLKLIIYYSEFVKPGGIMVYSTCSFMSQENDDIVASFLDNHPDFKPDSLIEPFSKFGVNLQFKGTDTYKITLLPSLHNCDGFFIARFKKD
jgi:16S rRNA (cytosine967-C5)-methyltransferase